MLTNWRVWNLTTVAAVGGAIIIGVTAPVRAAEVTYTLENAELTNDDAVTGSLFFDTSDNKITQASISVSSNGTVIDSYGINPNDTPVSYEVGLTDGSAFTSYIDLATQLTGAGGQTVQILTNEGLIVLPPNGSQTGYDDYYFQQGSVTDVSAGPSSVPGSVPEPSSIMATVTAVTLGVVLRRKKRKV